MAAKAKADPLKSKTIHPDVRIVFPIRRIRFGIILTLMGALIFFIGARPELVGMDRSPVIGFIQIGVMLVGLAIICLGGYWAIASLWHKRTLSIAAEIGMRFISTGYVVAAISGLADIIGLGSHPYAVVVPYFGYWQSRGVQIGEGIIALGLLLMFPYSRSDLFNGNHDHVSGKVSPVAK
jgi:hypothetical protein